MALYIVPTAAARSHLPVKANVVATLTTIQTIRHRIDFAKDLFLVPSIVSKYTKTQ